jgi:hypothetical protein
MWLKQVELESEKSEHELELRIKECSIQHRLVVLVQVLELNCHGIERMQNQVQKMNTVQRAECVKRCGRRSIDHAESVMEELNPMAQRA